MLEAGQIHVEFVDTGVVLDILENMECVNIGVFYEHASKNDIELLFSVEDMTAQEVVDKLTDDIIAHPDTKEYRVYYDLFVSYDGGCYESE